MYKTKYKYPCKKRNTSFKFSMHLLCVMSDPKSYGHRLTLRQDEERVCVGLRPHGPHFHIPDSHGKPLLWSSSLWPTRKPHCPSTGSLFICAHIRLLLSQLPVLLALGDPQLLPAILLLPQGSSLHTVVLNAWSPALAPQSQGHWLLSFLLFSSNVHFLAAPGVLLVFWLICFCL